MRPGAAVEQALGLVVAQADELLACRRHGIAVAVQFAQARVVEAPRLVEADEHLIGRHDGRGIDLAAADDAALAIGAGLQAAALAHHHRQVDDGIVLGLPMHLREHHVGLAFGEEAAALHRRQLGRIAEHQHRLAEGQEIAPELLVHHRAFVDDDEVGLRRPGSGG